MNSSHQSLGITCYFLISSECIPGFFLYDDACSNSCPKHFYPDLRQCVSCHENCLECNGPKQDDCKVCADTSKVLYNGLCLDMCPEGTYKEEENDECKGKDFWAALLSKEVWEACPHKACSRAITVPSHSSQDTLNLPPAQGSQV